jgi:hypothetical protein
MFIVTNINIKQTSEEIDAAGRGVRSIDERMKEEFIPKHQFQQLDAEGLQMERRCKVVWQ